MSVIENTSGLSVGDRVKMKSSAALKLAYDIEGACGTVIDIFSFEKYPWLRGEMDGDKAIVKLDNGFRCGEFSTHRNATDGCIVAKLYYNAVLLSSSSLNIEEII